MVNWEHHYQIHTFNNNLNDEEMTTSHLMCVMMSGKFPPRKIAPRSGSGFDLGLALELGLGAIFLGGNFPRTVCYESSCVIYDKNIMFERKKNINRETLDTKKFKRIKKLRNYLSSVNLSLQIFRSSRSHICFSK